MCKILVIPGITKKTAERAVVLMKMIAYSMCSNDKDGYGYVAATKSGALYGQRWADPTRRWTVKAEPTEFPEWLPVSTLASNTNKPDLDTTEVGQGPLTKEIPCILMAHARTATTPKGIANVHPFVRTLNDGTQIALIHNGVISNADALDLSGSNKCDSAAILNAYVSEQCRLGVENVGFLTQRLSGSHAVGMLVSQPGETPFVDVWRHSSSLSVSRVRTLGEVLYVFCTRWEFVRDACNQMRDTLWEGSAELLEDWVMRIGANGQCMAKSKFTTGGWTSSTGFEGHYYNRWVSAD